MTKPPNEGYALALETSGERGGVALGRGRVVLGSSALETFSRHAVDLLPKIAALCAAHHVSPRDIVRVMLSIGPGSFTGLRLGATVARMIALANEATVTTVPSHAVIARNALDLAEPPPLVAVLADAKRGRVYGTLFDRADSLYLARAATVEIEPSSLLSPFGAACAVMGEGVSRHRAAIEAAGCVILPESTFHARPETVYRLGASLLGGSRVVDRRDLIPLYIRPPECEEKTALPRRS
jgi:tRNA threonylcarbamoyladenosine biosynthesis protein TsaB